MHLRDADLFKMARVGLPQYVKGSALDPELRDTAVRDLSMQVPLEANSLRVVQDDAQRAAVCEQRDGVLRTSVFTEPIHDFARK